MLPHFKISICFISKLCLPLFFLLDYKIFALLKLKPRFETCNEYGLIYNLWNMNGEIENNAEKTASEKELLRMRKSENDLEIKSCRCWTIYTREELTAFSELK